MGLYTLDACNELINKYINDYNGSVIFIEEGVLGLGTVLLHGAENKKTIVIKEVYINDWSCGHSIRRYNKPSKKHQRIIDNQ